jgi:large subunit ribosomal protein L13
LTTAQARGCRKVVSKEEKLIHPNKTYEQAPDPRNWYLLDAAGKTLGRFATQVALILRGKHRPDFTPYVDSGDAVMIINADQIKVTGMKHARKIYRKHTGFVGGLREVPYSIMRDRDPEFILEHAIKGMMPKTRLGHQQLSKLRVFRSYQEGKEPVEYKEILRAQKPITVNG